MTATVKIQTLHVLLGGRDITDAPCPMCGPDRQAMANQRRRVLRLWGSAGFISFHCARCGERGFVRDDERRRVDPETLRRHRAMTAERERIEGEHRRHTALALWRKRLPITGSIAEVYLREVRGIACPLPATLGFLPARGAHPPAMIAAFGLAVEPEPGVLAITEENVTAVHLTRLAADGYGKADVEPCKLMIGRPLGHSIVLAPPNDLLGLGITEGTEDALSVHAATGLGAWAAGAAGFMPKLAQLIPDYVNTVTIYAHADPAGQRGAKALADELAARGIEVLIEGAAS